LREVGCRTSTIALEYLTEREVERLAGDNRHGHRDATMILLAFRHGLRASELCSLRWEQVDLAHGRLHVSREPRQRSRRSLCIRSSWFQPLEFRLLL